MAARRHSEHGLSIVELMVGVAVSLVITAAGASLLSTTLHDSRGLLLEARLMQDLRTAADLVSRDLRRAGYRGETAPALPNPYAALAPAGPASDAVSFAYSRDGTENLVVDSNERFGFRLRRGTLETQLGAGNWQALTDAATLTVTRFSVAPTMQTLDLEAFCATPCPPGAAACGPKQHVQSFALVIAGRLVADAAVERVLRSRVRVRNDAVDGVCST